MNTEYPIKLKVTIDPSIKTFMEYFTSQRFNQEELLIKKILRQYLKKENIDLEDAKHCRKLHKMNALNDYLLVYDNVVLGMMKFYFDKNSYNIRFDPNIKTF